MFSLSLFSDKKGWMNVKKLPLERISNGKLEAVTSKFTMYAVKVRSITQT